MIEYYVNLGYREIEQCSNHIMIIMWLLKCEASPLSRETLYDHCLRTGKQELLSSWDDANAPLTPKTISYGSKKKLWWHCKAGHRWQAPVYSRTSGSGCPYCHGKAVLTGDNDLESCFPAIAAQWDFRKNAPARPSEQLPQSHKRVWWRCEHGHEWAASIHSRVAGCGCPVCSGRIAVAGENSLADKFPLLCEQWDHEKNAPLTPEQVMPGSRRKVWWKCKKGHSWQAAISSRTAGSTACPVCSGRAVIAGENDLQTIFPNIAAQWDKEKNGSLSPSSVSPFSNYHVWWLCEKKHSYRATVSSRTSQASDCPYCRNRKVLAGFNDLKTQHPEVAAQWDKELNGNLTPDMLTSGSHRKVWWKCPLGHQWKTAVYARTGPSGTGCPVCAGRTYGANIKW